MFELIGGILLVAVFIAVTIVFAAFCGTVARNIYEWDELNHKHEEAMEDEEIELNLTWTETGRFKRNKQ